MKQKLTSKAECEAELARLPNLTISELRQRWGQLYKVPPPRCSSRNFLTYAIAYRLQEHAYGGLKPSAERALAKVVEQVKTGGKIVSLDLTKRARPGTKLLRTWQGITHEVTVLDDGVLYQGKQHRSLTEVAKIITGTHQSGHIFFGLRRAVRKA